MMIKNGKDHDMYDPRQRKNLILKIEKLWMHAFPFCKNNLTEETTFPDVFLMFEGLFYYHLQQAKGYRYVEGNNKAFYHIEDVVVTLFL